MTRSGLLNATTVNYQALIDNGQSYIVPLYQRGYSWGEEQWDDLWTEIVALRDDPRGRHYLGALVMEAVSEREYRIIDGQQRLATLGVLALAVIARLLDLADEGKDPEANRTWARRLRDRFVGEKHPAAVTEASRLTLSAANRDFYRDHLVQLRAPTSPQALSTSNRLLYECFLYFGRKLSGIEDLRDDGEALTNFIVEVVARRLLFVLIDVEDDGRAYTVFETMNARGLRLTTTDLLKNHLFSKCGETMVDLELLERRWRRLVDIVSPERFVDFLRSHLLTERAPLPRSSLFRAVSTEIRSPVEVFGLMNGLERRAEVFAAILDPNHERWRDTPEAQPSLEDLNLFGARELAPLLLTAWERFSRSEFARLLKLLAVISFRYRVVSGLNPAELETAAAIAARAVREEVATNPRGVFSLLESIYVDDRKMKQDFTGLRLRAYGGRRRLVRYILARLEGDVSGRACDPKTDPGTIEHILPEKPADGWDDEFPVGKHALFLHRLGNLTLLERRANRDIGNGAYREKVAAYGESGYTLTRRVAELAPERWTPEAIEKRQKQLAARAVQIWRADFA